MNISKQQIKDFLVAFSLVNLCFMRVWEAILSSQNYFFQKIPLSTLDFYALIINAIFFSSCFYLLIRLIRKSTSNKIKIVAATVLLIFALIPLNLIRLSLHLRFVNSLNYPIILIILVVILFAFLSYVIKSHPQTLLKTIYIILLLLSPLGFINAIKGLSSLKFIYFESTGPKISNNSAIHQKVILLIFDELDYFNLFISNQKPNLPNIAELLENSVFATNAYSPSNQTLLSIPSYIIGQTILDTQPINEKDALLTVEGIENKTLLSTFDSNLFSKISLLDIRTAIIGWHLPYCRLFGKWSTFCYTESSGLSYDSNDSRFLSKIIKQIQSLSPFFGRLQAITSYKEILLATHEILNKENINFIYIHWPIPHMPGLYNPITNNLSPFVFKNEYNNNLLLVDKTLGEIIAKIKKNNNWDETTLIVTADHGWRNRPENEKQWIRRIPFMIKLAGKNMTYKEINEPFNALILYDLIPALLNKEVSTPDEVANYINQNKDKFPIIDTSNNVH